MIQAKIKLFHSYESVHFSVPAGSPPLNCRSPTRWWSVSSSETTDHARTTTTHFLHQTRRVHHTGVVYCCKMGTSFFCFFLNATIFLVITIINTFFFLRALQSSCTVQLMVWTMERYPQHRWGCLGWIIGKWVSGISWKL